VPEPQILQAAAELFAERGYRGTTTVAIAERAGINEVTLFRKFGTKQGVLRELSKSWAMRLKDFSVHDAVERGDVRGVIEDLARTEFDNAARFGVAAMRLAMEASSTPEISEVMGSGPKGNLDRLAQYLADRQRAGEVRSDLNPWLMAEAFFALTSTQVIARQMLGFGNPSGETVDEVIRQIVEMCCSAVLTDGRGRARASKLMTSTTTST
jgi:AcrR family transcriptional regulator